MDGSRDHAKPVREQDITVHIVFHPAGALAAISPCVMVIESLFDSVIDDFGLIVSKFHEGHLAQARVAWTWARAMRYCFPPRVTACLLEDISAKSFSASA